MSTSARILDIVPGTTVDGPGLRTAVYMAGCVHRCPGCQNPDSWDHGAGRLMDFDEIVGIIDLNGFPVTLTGGDPLCSPDVTEPLIDRINRLDLGPVWLYTGFTFNQILADERLTRIARKTGVIVDGRFDRELRDTSLLFRGSSNQRLVDVAASLAAGHTVEWKPPF